MTGTRNIPLGQNETQGSLQEQKPLVPRKALFVVVTQLRDSGNAGNIQDYPYGVLSIVKYNENLADFDVLDVSVSEERLPEIENVLESKLCDF